MDADQTDSFRIFAFNFHEVDTVRACSLNCKPYTGARGGGRGAEEGGAEGGNE